jgi:hypothetical protein
MAFQNAISEVHPPPDTYPIHPRDQVHGGIPVAVQLVVKVLLNHLFRFWLLGDGSRPSLLRSGGNSLSVYSTLRISFGFFGSGFFEPDNVTGTNRIGLVVPFLAHWSQVRALLSDLIRN